jgi:hypothetical protein
MFERDSPVTAYWLTRCEGFRVGWGRRHGVVERVVLDLDTWQAAYLVVRYRGLGRPRVVAPGAVDAVVPAEERLVLRSRGRLDDEPAAMRVARWAVPALSRAGSALARGVRVAAVSAGLAALVLAQAAQVLAARGVARLASRSRASGFEHRPARR